MSKNRVFIHPRRAIERKKKKGEGSYVEERRVGRRRGHAWV